MRTLASVLQIFGMIGAIVFFGLWDWRAAGVAGSVEAVALGVALEWRDLNRALGS